MNKYFTKCGLYCGACSSLMMHEKAEGDPDLTNFTVQYEDSPCPGCATGGGFPDCEFILCNKEHNTECCAFCQEFPCEMIVKFSGDEWAHHRDVIENLKSIRDSGKEEWLKDQKKLWSCSNCGSRTHWYQTECRNCGSKWECRY